MSKLGDSFLEEAYSLVNGDRQAQYGSPLESFERTARLWSEVLGIEVTPEQVALCLVQLKMSREIANPKRDNLVDIAGYVEVVSMIERERDRRDALEFASRARHPAAMHAEYRAESVAMDTQ